MGKKRIRTIGEVPEEESKVAKKIRIKKEPEELSKAKQLTPESPAGEKGKSEKKSQLTKAPQDKKKKSKKERQKSLSSLELKKAKQRSANYQKAQKLVDREKLYEVKEAIELAKNSSYSKFTGSLEIHIKLGIKVEKSDQNIRGLVQMPNKTGKTPKILAFTDRTEEALKAGALYAGTDDLVSKIQKGFNDFNIAVAEPQALPKISKISKILGQKSKMPTEKAGTVSKELAKLIKSILSGRIEYKNDAYGIVHQNLGKLDMEDKKLLENLLVFYKAVLSAKPKGVKKDYIKTVTLSATMGPGIKVDIKSLNELLK